MKNDKTDKYSRKVYLERCVVAYDYKNRLIWAAGSLEHIHDFVKRQGIRVPKRTWVQVIEGATTLETRELYALDTKTFKGYYNAIFEEGFEQ